MTAHAHHLTSATIMPLAEVIGAFSYALDLTEGQPPGHCIRACWIGMHIGGLLQLSESKRWNLYYTLLLKDAGCSSNAARLCQLYGGDDIQIKKDYKLVNSQHRLQVAGFVLSHAGGSDSFMSKMSRFWELASSDEDFASELTVTRCERGADIAAKLGFSSEVADGIRYLDEHYNGLGKPYQLRGDSIPLASQIALLSQVFDVFYQTGGASAALAEIRRRANTWFDPELVKVCDALESDTYFWEVLQSPAIDQELTRLEPSEYMVTVNDDQLDRITEAFGMIVDVKSPFTHDHSARVASFSEAIAVKFGFDPVRTRWLKRAAYLHDIGKLGVSNTILDKPGKLDDKEWAQIRMHPVYTQNILGHLKPFMEIASLASAHHEKLDGTGYPLGLDAQQIKLETRIITVCDFFDALTARRPYRDAIGVAKSLAIIEAQLGSVIDPECFAALRQHTIDVGLLS